MLLVPCLSQSERMFKVAGGTYQQGPGRQAVKAFFIGILDITGFEMLDVSISGKSEVDVYLQEVRLCELNARRCSQSMMRIILC